MRIKNILMCMGCMLAAVDMSPALRVSPFVYDFDPTNDAQSEENSGVEKKKEFVYNITNKANQSIAFDIVVYRRYTDKNGTEKLVPDSDAFLVFPSQLIIKPHEERCVKLRWVGNKDFEKNPHQEQAFRVAIKQYRINLNPFKKEKKGSSVEFNLQVNTSLYMTPGKSKSLAKVIKIEKFSNGLSRVYVRNDGNRRITYGMISAEISIPGYKGPLNKVLNRDSSEGSLQPGEVHEFVVSAPSSQS